MKKLTLVALFLCAALSVFGEVHSKYVGNFFGDGAGLSNTAAGSLPNYVVTNGVPSSTGILITHGTPSFTSGQALSLSDIFDSYLANGFSSVTVYTNKITLFDSTFLGLTVSNGVISGNGAGLVNVPGSALPGYVVTNLPASNGTNDWAMLQTALSVPNSYIRFGGSYIVSNTLTPTNFIYVDGVQYGLSFARGLTNSLIDGGASNVMQSFVNIQFHGLEASNYNSVATIPITLQLPEVYDSGSGLSTRGSSVRNRNGLRINAGGGGIVQNCSFDGFSGCAVLTFNYQGTEAYKFNPTRFISLSASNNFIGFYGGGMFWDGIPSYNAFYNPSSFARNSSEYLQLINCYASGNGIGIYWSGGNASIRGCYSDNNFVDLAATGGNNNTHGDISASTFNHGTYGAVFTSASGGMFIKGCTFFANTLPIMVASGSGAVFMNDVFGGTPCVLVTNDLNSLSTLTYASFVGCYNAQFGATNFVNVVSSNCWAVGEANSDPFFGGNNDQSFTLGSWMLTNSTSTGLGVLSFSGHAGNGSGLTSLPSDLGTNTTQEGATIYGDKNKTNSTTFGPFGDTKTNNGTGNSVALAGNAVTVANSNQLIQARFTLTSTGATLVAWSASGTNTINQPTNGPTTFSGGASFNGIISGNGSGLTNVIASAVNGPLTNNISGASVTINVGSGSYTGGGVTIDTTGILMTGGGNNLRLNNAANVNSATITNGLVSGRVAITNAPGTTGTFLSVGTNAASPGFTVSESGLVTGNGSGLTNQPYAKTFASTNGYFSFALNSDGSTNVTFIITNLAYQYLNTNGWTAAANVLAYTNGGWQFIPMASGGAGGGGNVVSNSPVAFNQISTNGALVGIPGTNNNTGLEINSGALNPSPNNTNSTAYYIGNRRLATLNTYPVEAHWPVNASNSPLAIDYMPAPGTLDIANGNNVMALWMDFCSTNCITNQPPMSVLRIAKSGTALVTSIDYIGTTAYNGGTAAILKLGYNDTVALTMNSTPGIQVNGGLYNNGGSGDIGFNGGAWASFYVLNAAGKAIFFGPSADSKILYESSGVFSYYMNTNKFSGVVIATNGFTAPSGGVFSGNGSGLTNIGNFYFVSTNSTQLTITNAQNCRGVFTVNIAFDDVTGGNPSCTVWETNSVFTNFFGTISPNLSGLTLVGTVSVTNFYSFPAQTNSTLTIVDTSSGGAAVRKIVGNIWY